MPAKINVILSGFRRSFFGMAPKLLMGFGKHRLTSFMISIFLKEKGGIVEVLKASASLSYLKQLLEREKQTVFMTIKLLPDKHVMDTFIGVCVLFRCTLHSQKDSLTRF